MQYVLDYFFLHRIILYTKKELWVSPPLQFRFVICPRLTRIASATSVHTSQGFAKTETVGESLMHTPTPFFLADSCFAVPQHQQITVQ